MTKLTALAAPLRRLTLAVAMSLAACGLISSPTRAVARAQPAAKPDRAGLWSKGLAKIADWMRAEIAAKRSPARC